MKNILFILFIVPIFSFSQIGHFLDSVIIYSPDVNNSYNKSTKQEFGYDSNNNQNLSSSYNWDITLNNSPENVWSMPRVKACRRNVIRTWSSTSYR